MRQLLLQAITQIAAVTIAAAAAAVSLAAIRLGVVGFEAATSRDGLSRILGPFFVVQGVVFLALAVVALGVAWMAIKGRGTRHHLLVIAGALSVIAALPVYGHAPPADWALPGFSLAAGLFGLGFAAGTWLLGVAMRHLPQSRAGLAAFLGLTGAVLASPITVGALLADVAAAEAEWSVPPDVRTRLHEEAHSFWDHPLQRLVYVEFAVAGKFSTRRCGSGYRVEAFTAFGLRVDSIEVDDCDTR